MKELVAALTMVKEDIFFLRTWIKYYGNLLGNENLYVINHGRSQLVAQEASMCNVIGIPEGDPSGFDRVRWKLLNSLLKGFQNYYSYVIVGDVDEIVVVDPLSGKDLKSWLAQTEDQQVFTPLGLELVHDPDSELHQVDQHILGPRRFVRTSMRYSKPCIASSETSYSRGGHFSTCSKIETPEHLFLFHLKYCDFQIYCDTADSRNRFSSTATSSQDRKVFIGRHWFSDFRGDDRAVFEDTSKRPLSDAFDFRLHRALMRTTFRNRKDTGFYQFDLNDDEIKFELPERFFGIF